MKILGNFLRENTFFYQIAIAWVDHSILKNYILKNVAL